MDDWNKEVLGKSQIWVENQLFSQTAPKDFWKADTKVLRSFTWFIYFVYYWFIYGYDFWLNFSISSNETIFLIFVNLQAMVKLFFFWHHAYNFLLSSDKSFLSLSWISIYIFHDLYISWFIYFMIYIIHDLYNLWFIYFMIYIFHDLVFFTSCKGYIS